MTALTTTMTRMTKTITQQMTALITTMPRMTKARTQQMTALITTVTRMTNDTDAGIEGIDDTDEPQRYSTDDDIYMTTTVR